MTTDKLFLALAVSACAGGCFTPDGSSGGAAGDGTDETGAASSTATSGETSAGPTGTAGTSGASDPGSTTASSDVGETSEGGTDESTSSGVEPPADSSGDSGDNAGSSSGLGISESSTGEPSDLPPEVTITVPNGDLLGGAGPTYDGYDMGLQLWYADVDLTAVATDPEDGDISNLVTWTTDQSGIQSPGLGAGASVTVRLYSDDCFGVLHTITAEVIDSDNNLAMSGPRQINIWTLC